MAMAVLRYNAPHIARSGDAAMDAGRALVSICLAVLSLFLIASGVRSVEGAGVVHAGERQTNQPGA